MARNFAEDWPSGGNLRGIKFSFDVLEEETIEISISVKNITNDWISWSANGHDFRILYVDDCNNDTVIDWTCSSRTWYVPYWPYPRQSS